MPLTNYQQIKHYRFKITSNCTTELHPLDFEIIRSFKHYYHKNLIQILLSKLRRKKDHKNFNLSIIDAMYYIVKSWGEIEEITVCMKEICMTNMNGIELLFIATKLNPRNEIFVSWKEKWSMENNSKAFRYYWKDS